MRLRRPRNQIARQSPRREPYDRVLIVCEGKRTEPLYFRETANRYRLSTANIVVTSHGPDPRTLVREAKKLRSIELRNGEKYDKVYCVFDRDAHVTFDQACDEAKASGIELARSWPCFEFWLRLHFGFSRRPYERSGNRSAAQNCVEELRRLLPGYAKGAPDLFHRLEDRLERTKVDAARTLTDAKATGEFNPSTEVHDLIDYLQSLKPERDLQGHNP
ncbi:MAG: RloB family protein [Gammaproteobacteria bacterium]|nr:RloB family protein [Gammaproteobacteria bacterium]